jgi:hypothetical protein
MLNGKFLTILAGIFLAIFAVLKADYSPVKENFLTGFAMTRTAMPYTKTERGNVALQGSSSTYLNMRGSDKFFSSPGFQSAISPRFSTLNYGANIKYNMPDKKNLAVPSDPLTYADMATEGYNPNVSRAQNQARNQVAVENYGCGSGGCSSPPSCGAGGYGMGHKVSSDYEVPPGYTNGNFQQIYDGLPGPVVSRPCDDSSNAELPLGTMSTMDGAGNDQQFVVMERMMNAPLKNRLYAHGDFIRGDLMISPCVGDWFTVPARPDQSLNPGALQVMAGNGESNNKTLALITAASGGARTALGGVDLTEQINSNSLSSAMMATQNLSSVTAAASDLNVTAFP